ncbi:hypothetical protein HUX53_03695, partial [Actinomadura sp. BRA 177]|nr:hypothetical protein [Actinomadura sp. BRA 177]
MTAPPAARLLHRHIRGQWPALRRLAAWSALESLPVFASGLLLARAIDRGFLSGRPLAGLGWLAALAGLYAAGAVGTGRVYPWLAATVEPLRDSLVREVVTAALHRMTGGSPDAAGAGVSQVTEQAEAVPALHSQLLRHEPDPQFAGGAVPDRTAPGRPRLLYTSPRPRNGNLSRNAASDWKTKKQQYNNMTN